MRQPDKKITDSTGTFLLTTITNVTTMTTTPTSTSTTCTITTVSTMMATAPLLQLPNYKNSHIEPPI